MGWSGGGGFNAPRRVEGISQGRFGEIRRGCGEVDIAFQVASGCDATKSVLTKG